MGHVEEAGGAVPSRSGTENFESTAALIHRARSGDREAREKLAGRYLPLLRRWAHGRLPSRARALWETSDLVQVTLLRALDQLDRFEPRREGAFLAYLRSALMNLLRNEIRRSARDPKAGLPANASEDRGSFLEEMMGREMLEAYEAALAVLPRAVQESVILRLEFGYTYPEIAEATGAPSTDAVRMSVSRAVVRLSAAMDAHR